MAESVNKIMNLPNCDDLFHIDVRGEIKFVPIIFLNFFFFFNKVRIS